MSKFEEKISKSLEGLSLSGNLRTLPKMDRDVVSLSSNDYLGLAGRMDLKQEFLDKLSTETFLPSSSSSRLLTGNFDVYEKLEEELSSAYGSEAALIFNSGYHINLGILPAICDDKTLILADKLVHASIIDGMRLASSANKGMGVHRFRHNDYFHLEKLLEKYSPSYETIIIVIESIYSMDGDLADLRHLVGIKKNYPGTLLYVDEAHSVGVRGERGLGLAEELGIIPDIDILVATFGKAFASMGAYLVCNSALKSYLVNKSRSLIYSTALPPINIEWSNFLLSRMASFSEERAHLRRISEYFSKSMTILSSKEGASSQLGGGNWSHIVPLVVGSSCEALALAEKISVRGFKAMAVRPPTVPEGSARIRFSLGAGMTMTEVEELICILKEIKDETGMDF